jgi:hypothetical protein
MRTRSLIVATLALSLMTLGAPGEGAAVRLALPCSPGQATRLVVPSGGRAYHSAYFSAKPNETVYTAAWINEWVAMTGKQPAVIVFSNHWGANGRLHISFPAETVQTIWDSGAVPDLRMMAWTRDWSSSGPDPVISLQRIVDGRFDKDLRRWFREARDLGIPMMIEFGVEVNGEWFPWNGLWNGAGRKDGYGDGSYPDGPERFIDAYRHLHDLAGATGADDLTWVFHPDVGSYPHKAWNQPELYYPGDSYVDWVVFSDYGEQKPTEDYWEAFAQRLGNPANQDSIYSRLRNIAPSKPFGVIEFGVTEGGDGDKAQWYTQAYDSFTPPGNAYDLDIASVWSEKWHNGDGSLSDLRVDSSLEALAAYKAAIADPHFASTPEWSCT